MRSTLLAAAVVVSLNSAALAEIPLSATRIASGLHNPLFVTSAPGEPDRLYILEQTGVGSYSTAGVVRTFDVTTNTLSPDPFLVVPNVSTGGEQGLLGLAFHPDYATNGKLYVDFTLSNGSIQVSQYARQSGGTAAFAQPILTIPHPDNANHNGGWIGFKPGSNAGNLYIGVGDGGSGNDPPNNAQTIDDNLLGKMLRINIDSDGFADVNRNYAIPAGNPFTGTGGDDEIWDYGLRNPWRSSFDRKTGDLYIGDVGQGTAEEIDFHKSTDVGGKNFGWRKFEGLNERPGGSEDNLGGPSGHTPPIHEYAHGSGASVTGGYVYRGSENPALEGTYFFTDFITSQIWSFKYDGQNKTKFRELTGTITTPAGMSLNNISSFGEDAAGNLYIVERGGDIFRLIPAMPGDANLDNVVDVTDLSALALHWNEQGTATWAHGDFTDDGFVNVADLYQLALRWDNATGGPSLAQALAAFDLPPVSLPEPGAITVIGMSVLLAVRRRGRV